MRGVDVQYDEVAGDYERYIAPKYRRIASLAADRVPRSDCLAAARMLDVARRHVPTEMELAVADLHAVPVPNRSTDVVVASLSPAQDTVRGSR
jgi:hypothetical protein